MGKITADEFMKKYCGDYEWKEFSTAYVIKQKIPPILYHSLCMTNLKYSISQNTCRIYK